MVKDNVSDFLAKLKNAGAAKKSTVIFPYSKFIVAIAELLQKEKYLTAIERKGKRMAKFIEVTLAYNEAGDCRISGISRVSKPSRRVYSKSTGLYPVLNGLGRIVLSTPQGLMTDRTARKGKVGGEILFKIW